MTQQTYTLLIYTGADEDEPIPQLTSGDTDDEAIGNAAAILLQLRRLHPEIKAAAVGRAVPSDLQQSDAIVWLGEWRWSDRGLEWHAPGDDIAAPADSALRASGS